MKKILMSIILSLVLLFNGFSQYEKSSIQVGISALPIYDVLNLFPDNQISGVVVMPNFGFFIMDKLSFGINPYYAKASNSYNSAAIDKHKENQQISLYGLNAYLRYYFITKEKISFYAMFSNGFGDIEKKTTNLSTSAKVDNGYPNKAIYTAMLGVGIDYFVTKKIAIELNVPFIVMRFFSPEQYDSNFNTIVPTLGLQIYWK